MSEFTKTAVDRLTKELGKVEKNRYVDVVKKPVYDALVSFCSQSEEFAQAVAESDQTLNDCLKSVVDGVKSSLSDIEAYRRAAAFYFSECEVDMKLSIRMSRYDDKPADESEATDTTPKAKTNREERAINLSLMDLL